MKSVLDKIEQHTKISKKINEDIEYTVDEMDAIELLKPERIDLIAKLQFLKYIDHKISFSFVEELYEAHLKAFNGNKKCSEAGNNQKNNLEDYIQSFKKTAKDIKDNGFDPDKSMIPVGENNVLLDGAHRTASAIYFHKKINIIRFEGIKENYNYLFFRKNLLDEKYLDYMVTEYCKRKNNTYAFCIWPAAPKEYREQAYHLIRKHTSVIYEKKIDLNYNGYRNFMIQIYNDHTNWIGSYADHYKGVYSQLDLCYKSNTPLELFVVESVSKEFIIDLKRTIRNIFNIGNYSVHSTDEQIETVKMLEVLLNKNSIELLNKGRPDKYIKLNEKIDILIKKIDYYNLDRESLIIDSGAVLALFGLRDTSDLDYLALSESYDVLEDEMIENHINNFRFYGVNMEELILNPQNYLVYQGIKFVTLDILKKMKINRNSEKDLLDIKLIDGFVHKKMGLNFKITEVKIKYIYIKRWIRLVLINILKTIHLYDFVYYIYKKKKN